MSVFARRLIVIALLTSMVLGLLYVGDKSNREIEEIQKNSVVKTETVYFWYTDEACADFFTKAAVDFHALNPGIRVIPVYVSYSEYLEKINEASLADESFPDLFLLSNDSLEKAYLAGLASNVIDSENVLTITHFSRAALNAVTYKGNYVGYPLSFETSVLLYNKTYLENWIERVNSGEKIDSGEEVSAEDMEMEDDDSLDAIDESSVEDTSSKKQLTLSDLIPESFDDLIDFADSYEAEEGVEGVLKWDVSDIFYNYMFVGNYMSVGGETGDDSTNYDILNEDTVKCVNVYQNLNQVFSIDAASSSYEKMLNDFLDGKIIFTIATSDAIAKINETVALKEALLKAEADADALDASNSSEEEESSGDNLYSIGTIEEKIVSFEYGYARMPDVSDTLGSKSLSVTDALVVNGYSEVKEEANKFAAFLSTACAPELYAKTGRLSASVDAGYTDEAFRVFQSEYSHSIPLPKIVETSNLWVQLEIAFTEIWAGEDAEKRLEKFSNQIDLQIGNKTE